MGCDLACSFIPQRFRFVCKSIFTGVLTCMDIGLFYIVFWWQPFFTGEFHIVYRLLAAATGKNVAFNSSAASAKRAQLSMLLNLLVSCLVYGLVPAAMPHQDNCHVAWCLPVAARPCKARGLCG
eukprot:IDg4620t1